MNLALSKRGDYVVRSAICLARAHGSGAQTKLREISGEMEIPRTFVSQILGDLVHAGIAVSAAGKDGGYRLAAPPEDVTLLAIVEAAEGPLSAEGCALGEGPCHWEEVCPLHESWSAATAAVVNVLSSTSLAELAERDRRLEEGSYPVPDDAHRARPAFVAGVAVADSVQVELPAQVVAARVGAGASWLGRHAEAASADGAAVQVKVGPGGPAWLGKTVRVRLGTAKGGDACITIPLAWEATGPTGLFPRLEGELRIAAVDPERTELHLAGRYRPPFGRAGQVIDEALLARVARSTVRSFLRRVARALDAAPGTVPGTAAGTVRRAKERAAAQPEPA